MRQYVVTIRTTGSQGAYTRNLRATSEAEAKRRAIGDYRLKVPNVVVSDVVVREQGPPEPLYRAVALSPHTSTNIREDCIVIEQDRGSVTLSRAEMEALIREYRR